MMALKPPLSVFIRVHLCLKIPSPKIRIPDLIPTALNSDRSTWPGKPGITGWTVCADVSEFRAPGISRVLNVASDEAAQDRFGLGGAEPDGRDIFDHLVVLLADQL